MAQNDLNGSILSNYTSSVFSDATTESPTAFDGGGGGVGVNTNDDWSLETLQQTRFIIQRIFVPSVVTIGIAGNLLTVIVMTRYVVRLFVCSVFSLSFSQDLITLIIIMKLITVSIKSTI